MPSKENYGLYLFVEPNPGSSILHKPLIQDFYVPTAKFCISPSAWFIEKLKYCETIVIDFTIAQGLISTSRLTAELSMTYCVISVDLIKICFVWKRWISRMTQKLICDAMFNILLK